MCRRPVFPDYLPFSRDYGFTFVLVTYNSRLTILSIILDVKFGVKLAKKSPGFSGKESITIHDFFLNFMSILCIILDHSGDFLSLL